MIKDKFWFLSGKVLTILVLIIFPISYITICILTGFSIPYLFRVETIFLPSGSFFTTLSPCNAANQCYVIIPPIPLLIVLLVFAFFPAIYSTPKFFKKRGFENVIIEYQYLKKILYSSIVFLIALIGLYYYYLNELNISINQTSPEQESYLKLNQNITEMLKELSPQKMEEISKNGLTPQEVERINNLNKQLDESERLLKQIAGPRIPVDYLDDLYFILFMIPAIPISIVIKLLLEHGRKKFKLYYAKGCFRIASKETTDEIDKARYFMIGLAWYNRYLKKNINLQIKDMTRICSKVITHSPLDTNKRLVSISESFDSEDELKPLRYLSFFFPDTKEEEILTKESLRTRIQESSDLIIPIITTIITIITTFFLPKP